MTRIRRVFQSILVCGLFAAAFPATAMHLEVIAAHSYDLNIEYHVYRNQQGHFSEMSDRIKALESAYLQSWVNVFNDSVATQSPDASAMGEPTRITFGYKKNNQDVFPSSCFDIPLREFSTVTLTEDGCRVS